MPDLTDFQPFFASRLDAYRAALTKAGIDTSVISGYRSPEYQQQLINQGVRPAAQPWRSYHQYGLAADLQPKNAADYGRMWNMAPQFGLHALGAFDPGHVQMQGALNDLVNQYHLQGWRPQDQPAPGAGAIAANAPPGGGVSRAPGTTLTSNPFVQALGNAESNWRNIPSGVDKDPAGFPGGKSQGYLQIDTPTWRQYAPGLGVTAPNAMAASAADQIKVASAIPFSRFGPRTRDMLHAQFGKFDDSSTVGQLAANYAPGATLNTTGGPSVGAQTGSASGGPAAAPGSAPTTPGAWGSGQPAPWQQGLQSAAKTMGITNPFDQGGMPEQTRAPEAPPIPLSRAAGGPMMMGAGGQNTAGQRMAQEALAAQGFNMSPMPANFAPSGATMPPVGAGPPGAPPAGYMAPGAAGAVPSQGLPGTSLSSPSQLQMALLYGLPPYGGGYGTMMGGSGSY